MRERAAKAPRVLSSRRCTGYLIADITLATLVARDRLFAGRGGDPERGEESAVACRRWIPTSSLCTGAFAPLLSAVASVTEN